MNARETPNGLPDAAHPDRVPEGFALMQRPGFLNHIGSIYVNVERRTLGARIKPQHLNPLGIAHGGMLATLADTGFGMAIKLASGAEFPPVTVSLNIDYLSPAREGDWVEVRVDVHKLGGRIANASCTLWAGERLVGRGSAIFLAPARATP